MKKSLVKLVLCSGLLAVSSGLAGCGSSESEMIAIVKYGQHTSLDEIENAVVTEIKEKLGSKADKYNIKQYNCEFDGGNVSQTLSSLKEKNVKAIVAIATPVAAVAKSMFSDVPVVFAAVSDPAGSDIVSNLASPEGNVTGTSDYVDVKMLVDLAYNVSPKTSNIGYIYCASEANSITNYNALVSYSQSKGFALKAKSISESAEITEVANSIINDIDALVVTDDNTVASAMGVLSEIAKKSNVPVYCAADSEIKDGGMMGYSISYTDLGKNTGDMVYEIINGKAVKDIPVKVYSAEELTLYYNSSFISSTSITVSETLLKDAVDLAAK